MKTIRVKWNIALLPIGLLVTTLTFAQVPTTPTVPTMKSPSSGAIKDPTMAPSGMVKDTSVTASSTENLPEAQLDKAVDALAKGDKAGSATALQTGIAALETEVKQKPTSFKDKVLSQVSKLKALLPLIAGGGLGSSVLQKAVGLTKLASGANRLEGLMSVGSLIGNASKVTNSLSGIGSAMSVLGGGTQTAGQSLISTAMSEVGKLAGGGALAQAAEPAVRTQLGSVLSFVKGAL